MLVLIIDNAKPKMLIEPKLNMVYRLPKCDLYDHPESFVWEWDFRTVLTIHDFNKEILFSAIKCFDRGNKLFAGVPMLVFINPNMTSNIYDWDMQADGSVYFLRERER